jgi:hypothetical protein
MSTPTSKLNRDFVRLTAAIAPDGWICKGSAIERAYSRGAMGKKKLYGPYYSWTRKEDNKTVTFALSREQFLLLRRAIRRHRTLDAAIRTLRKISEHYILDATPGVTSRYRKQPA